MSTSSTSITSQVSSIYRNSQLSSLANKYGLNISSVTWEDTSRTKGSCYGDNISDMTLAVTK